MALLWHRSLTSIPASGPGGSSKVTFLSTSNFSSGRARGLQRREISRPGREADR